MNLSLGIKIHYCLIVRKDELCSTKKAVVTKDVVMYVSFIPLLLVHEVAVSTIAAPVSGARDDLLVLGEGDVAGLDLPEILDEHVVAVLDFLGGLVAANGPGEVVPPVGRVPVIEGQCVLEQLVLLRGPRAGAAAARARSRCHGRWSMFR